MPPRLFCTIFLLISVCAFPVFFTVGIGLFSIVWFQDYYEAIPIAFMSDAIYGVSTEHFHSFPFVMTLVTAVLVLVSVGVRTQLLDTSPRRV